MNTSPKFIYVISTHLIETEKTDHWISGVRTTLTSALKLADLQLAAIKREIPVTELGKIQQSKQVSSISANKPKTVYWSDAFQIKVTLELVKI